MKTATKDRLSYLHSPHSEPAITVEPGEIFRVETELCTGSWLQKAEDRFDPNNRSPGNPTVVVKIAGALPGERLAVEILDIKLGPLGYTGFQDTPNSVARLIYNRDWGLTTRTVRIENNEVLWSNRLRLPVKPMIGTLGTAPATESLSNTKAGPHGGNMDAQEVTVDSTVYLPVAVPGALLHIGDCHAIQGDGEINNGGGIECRATVTLRTSRVQKPARTNCVRIENDTHIMAIACERSLEESFYLASRELFCWLVDSYDFSEEEAYLLMGQIMEARCTQFVNPTRTYICKLPRKFLIPESP
jgi:amidase